MKATAIDTSTDNDTADDERRLVQRARAGDMSAFEGLYRRHAGRVHALCLRMSGGDAAIAEDCVQEAFVSAWQHLAGFAGDSRFGTWLHRIAVNQVLGQKRRQQRRDRHLRLVDPPAGDGDGDGPDPLERVAAPAADDGAQLDLEAAIGALPEQARHVFVLTALNGYTHEEAGELLGIAVGTSKAQLHRARKLLMQRLAG